MTKQSLKIKEALLTLADYLDMTPEQVANNVCFLDKEKFAKLKKASEEWNKFDDEKDVRKRAEMLGYEVEYGNN